MSRSLFLKLLSFFLIWRICLFGVGLLAPTVLKYQPSFPYFDTILPKYDLPQWLYSWANFDGVHYITIGEKGYVGTGLVQAFFPLLPYVFLHLPKLWFGSYNILLTGLLLSNIFALLLVLIWFQFVKELWNQKTAWFSLLVLFLFPTSFFLGAFYTESLFLCLVLGAFLAARKQWWWLVAVCAVGATATRVVGAFLIPSLYLEIWLQYREKHKQISVSEFFKTQWSKLLLVSSGMLGLGVYMWFLYGEFKDPLYFLHVQAEFGGGRSEGLVWYPQVLWRYFKILLTARPINLRYLVYIQEFLAGVVGLIGIIWSARKVRLSYVLFSFAAFILPTLTGTFSSLPRYLLVSFSVFWWLSMALNEHKSARLWWLLGSTLLLIFNTMLFIQGYWMA